MKKKKTPKYIWTVDLHSYPEGAILTLTVNEIDIMSWTGMPLKELTSLFETLTTLMQVLDVGGHLVGLVPVFIEEKAAVSAEVALKGGVDLEQGQLMVVELKAGLHLMDLIDLAGQVEVVSSADGFLLEPPAEDAVLPEVLGLVVPALDRIIAGIVVVLPEKVPILLLHV